MMTNRSFFEAFPDSAEPQAPSPFIAASEPESSPFIAVHEPVPVPQIQSTTQTAPSKPSPFTVIDEGSERPPEAYRPAKIPEKRKQDSPFQIVDSSDGYGVLHGIPMSPFDAVYPSSPFAPAARSHDFGAFATPPQVHAQPFPHQPYTPQSTFAQPTFAFPGAYPPAPMPPPAPFPQTYAQPQPSRSSPIRQLELRAIFSVDHEMSVDEILQRCRALPTIRHIAYLGGQDAGTVESLKSLLAKLGFGDGSHRIYADPMQVEFIREGKILLAFQADAGLAPGVRETLMIVARELARLA